MSTWHAVLGEVRQQTARAGGHNSGIDDSWLDLAENSTTTASLGQATLVWQQQQWHNAFEVLFFQGPTTSAQEQDDLLFFVYLELYQAETPYFVRRKSKALPTELQTAGEKARQVDWKRSVLLNLVTQTTYSLTVAACTREHLQSVGSSRTASPSSRQVSKAVFASTTKSQLNLTNQRADESNPTLTYPDISFAVEDFEEAFESLMLTQPSQCYLVLLIATAGLTFGAQESLSQGSRERIKQDPSQPPSTPPLGPPQEPATLVGQGREQPWVKLSLQRPGSLLQDTTTPSRDTTSRRRLTVFSGFVSYEQLEQKVLGGQAKGVPWMSKNVEGPHPVRMRGPGGQGFADVAVTCLTRAAASQSQQKEDAQGPPLSPNLTWQELQGHTSSASSSPEKARAGLLGAAFGAAANALKAIGNPGKSSKGPQAPKQAPVYDMRCALMNLSLPVEPLVLQLLQ